MQLVPIPRFDSQSQTESQWGPTQRHLHMRLLEDGQCHAVMVAGPNADAKCGLRRTAHIRNIPLALESYSPEAVPEPTDTAPDLPGASPEPSATTPDALPEPVVAGVVTATTPDDLHRVEGPTIRHNSDNTGRRHRCRLGATVRCRAALDALFFRGLHVSSRHHRIMRLTRPNYCVPSCAVATAQGHRPCAG